MGAPKGNRFATHERKALTPLQRFVSFCRFEPETGCVVWTGGKTKGRGHNVDYPSFWFNGKRWFGHRWAAKFIHGQDIDGFHTDHCCPHRPLPNTLCVEHVQSLTPRENRELQFTRRKQFIHMQVGLLPYEDVYKMPAYLTDDTELIPFYEPPAWLIAASQEHTHGNIDHTICPF